MKTREEIAKKIDDISNTASSSESICELIADWHLSEVALAERAARVEVVNSIKLLATTAGLGAMNRYMEETITANSEPVREGDKV